MGNSNLEKLKIQIVDYLTPLPQNLFHKLIEEQFNTNSEDLYSAAEELVEEGIIQTNNQPGFYNAGEAPEVQVLEAKLP